MRQYERNGVTVDQCGECRGIFLDRGELERLIDAESAFYGGPAQGNAQPRASTSPAAATQYGNPQQHSSRHRDYDSDEYPVYGLGGHGRPKRRGGFLSELFD
jgi:Zn-finger nucleic acid-binding protein